MNATTRDEATTLGKLEGEWTYNVFLDEDDESAIVTVPHMPSETWTTSVHRTHGVPLGAFLTRIFVRLRYRARSDVTDYAHAHGRLKTTWCLRPFDEASVNDDSVGDELRMIRAHTALSVADIARLCGLQRRHIYNLFEGQPTEPHRAARIRVIADAIARWAKQLTTPTQLRSALFAPLDDAHRDFIAIASSGDPDDVRTAIRLFDAYVKKLGSARPIVRTRSATPREQREALDDLRALYGDADDSTQA